MADDQPLPVRFHAAIALEKNLQNKVAMKFIKPGISKILDCYLGLMDEFEN